MEVVFCLSAFQKLFVVGKESQTKMGEVRGANKEGVSGLHEGAVHEE